MTQPTTPTQDPPALVLADRYRVFEVLGRGGMAAVHRGHDDRLDRPVAVKLLHAHLADDEQVRDRFRREAVAAARLNHPGVVGVYDHWRGGEEDPPYIVMELVEGGSVRDVLAVRGVLTPGQTLALLRPAMTGLADAHRRGIVHRDVTPANVLVDTTGASKLGDFGLARVAAASTATFPEDVVGSPHYMSPEAVRGEPLDTRADVYSLGCVLFQCLTGTTPFDGDSPQAIALRHGTDPVPAPSSRVGGISRRLDDVVTTATAMDPADRYEDAGELVRALDAAVPEGPEPIDLRTETTNLRIDGSHATTVLPDDPSHTAAGSLRPRRRSTAVLVALLAVLLVSTGAWATWDRVVAPVTALPAVTGETVPDARAVLEAAGFRVAVADERRTDPDVPAGSVVDQDPVGEARRGTTVRLVASAGPRTGELPVLTGRELDAARGALDGLGLDLTVATVDTYDDEAPAGTVVSSVPAAGATVEEGSTVELAVSRGPAPVEVPVLRGQGQVAATATLGELGLDAVVVDQRHDDDLESGAVLATRPAAGTELRRGDEVGLVLSRGPAPVEVPDVRGAREADAVSQLESLGFEVDVRYVPRILPLRLGTVDDQAPSPGQVRPRGSTVRIFVWELG